MYDLTSFLTTISAGSASFAAILGGMIATKVIEINNTRFAVEEEIKELTEKREFYEKDLQRISTARSEDHAICFIGNHEEQFLEAFPVSEEKESTIYTAGNEKWALSVLGFLLPYVWCFLYFLYLLRQSSMGHILRSKVFLLYCLLPGFSVRCCFSAGC